METIPLVAHQSAATIEGRLEGLVFFDDGNVDDNSLWTAQDTANALDQCPYEEYLGLKLYGRSNVQDTTLCANYRC